MKLLAVSTWLPWPLDNGSRVRAYHLLRHLSRRHALTLVCFGAPPTPGDRAPFDALCTRVEIVPPSMIPGNRLGARGLLSSTPRHYVQTDSPVMRTLVAAAVPGHDVAIGLQAEAARYLAESHGIPRVFEEAEVGLFRDRCRDVPTVRERARHTVTWLKHRRFMRRLVDAFDHTTVVSATEREHLRAIGCDAERVSVVPNGIEAPQLPPPRARAARLIYPGSVMYSANLDAVRFFVEDIWPLIRQVRPDLQFVVTGSTDGVEVASLATSPGVRFTGRLPEVDTLIAESAACVVPLRVGGGTRLKILQAMALGTPVVSTTKGIEGLDLLRDDHVLVGDSPAAFAGCVLRLLGDGGLENRITEAARRLVHGKYTWSSIGEAFERAIGQAVRHCAGRRGRAATAS